jgi:hypothetical protein
MMYPTIVDHQRISSRSADLRPEPKTVRDRKAIYLPGIESLPPGGCRTMTRLRDTADAVIVGHRFSRMSITIWQVIGAVSLIACFRLGQVGAHHGRGEH